MTSIGQPGQVDQTDTEQVIVGVDTHRDVHVAAAVTTLGGVLGSRPFPATTAGYHRLLGWARGFGTVRRAGVEGTGCYGAALARYLRGQDIQVVEVNRPDWAVRRQRGKNDAVDAEVAARTVLSGQPLVTPKTTDGPVEMVRVFKLVRDSAVKARTQAINQLKAVLVGADPALRENLSRLSAATLVRRCTQLADPAEGGTASAVVHTLRLLARRVQQLSAEARDLAGRITAVLAAQAPRLLDRVGVGPDIAAALLMAAGDNP